MQETEAGSCDRRWSAALVPGQACSAGTSRFVIWTLAVGAHWIVRNRLVGGMQWAMRRTTGFVLHVRVPSLLADHVRS